MVSVPKQCPLCFGAAPKKILMPFVKQSLETAMLPTINSMIGMGVVSLPGMMTGQILSGTLPTTAILYQIAIMIAICIMVTSASFWSSCIWLPDFVRLQKTDYLKQKRLPENRKLFYVFFLFCYF